MGGKSSKPKQAEYPELGSRIPSAAASSPSAGKGSFEDIQRGFNAAVQAPTTTSALPPAGPMKKQKRRGLFGRLLGGKSSKPTVRECPALPVLAEDNPPARAPPSRAASGVGVAVGVAAPTSPAPSSPSTSASGRGGGGANSAGKGGASSTGSPAKAAADPVERAAAIARARQMGASITRIVSTGSAQSADAAAAGGGGGIRGQLQAFRQYELEVQYAAQALLAFEAKARSDRKRLKQLAAALHPDEQLRRVQSAEATAPRPEAGKTLDVQMAKHLSCYAELCGAMLGKLTAKMATMPPALRPPASAYLAALGRHQALASAAEAELGGAAARR